MFLKSQCQTEKRRSSGEIVLSLALIRQIEPATAADGGANQFLDSVPDCPDAAVMTGNLFICISIQIKVARMPESGHPVRLFGQ
ncbi:hypothetical protein DBV33_16675 [Pseudomonas fluorescens]|nr:hypothetical protein DBV33_16675 [Pseudomonas fluorescens]